MFSRVIERAISAERVSKRSDLVSMATVGKKSRNHGNLWGPLGRPTWEQLVEKRRQTFVKRVLKADSSTLSYILL